MDEKRPSTHPTEDIAAGHEKTDAHAKPIFYFLAGLSALIVIALAITMWLFHYLESQEAAADKPVSPLADPFELPPGPRLDITPRGELDFVLQETRGKLEGYAWIDEEAQVVRIPIERAMELTLQQGFPVRRPAGGNQTEASEVK